jgi:hypothetical protein
MTASSNTFADFRGERTADLKRAPREDELRHLLATYEREGGDDSQPRYTREAAPSFASGAHAEPQWAVEGIWPAGASGLTAGRPKDGKSSLAVELAISLWTGTPMFGVDAFPSRLPPQPVLYIQQEFVAPRRQ